MQTTKTDNKMQQSTLFKKMLSLANRLRKEELPTITKEELKSILCRRADLDSRYVTPEGTKIDTSRIPTYYKGIIPSNIPPAVWAPLQCPYCFKSTNGLFSLSRHFENSHPRATSINVLFDPAYKIEQPTAPADPSLSEEFARMTLKAKRPRVDAEAEMESTNSLAPGAVGADPTATATQNAANIMEAQTATGGLEMAAAPDAPVSGVAAVGAAPIEFLGPSIPPGMGAMTGLQWTSYQADLAAFSTVVDTVVPTATGITGTEVASVRLHQYGPQMNQRLLENTFVEGSTEAMIQFYATPGTAGSLIAYYSPLGIAIPEVDNMLRLPHVIMSAAAGTTTHCVRIYDVRTDTLSRRTHDLDATRRPGIFIAMYAPPQNTFGSNLDLSLKILTRPGPTFRMWEPYVGSDPIQEAVYALPGRNFLSVDVNGNTISSEGTDFTTPNLEKYQREGASSMPQSIDPQSGSFAMSDTGIDGTTGMINPVLMTSGMFSDDGEAPYVFHKLAIRAGPSTPILTNIPSPAATLLTEFGTLPAPEDLDVSIADAVGFVGIDTRAIGNPLNTLVKRGSAGGSYAEYRSYEYVDRRGGKNALNGESFTDSPVTATNSLGPGILTSGDYRTFVLTNQLPPVVSPLLAGNACLPWDEGAFQVAEVAKTIFADLSSTLGSAIQFSALHNNKVLGEVVVAQESAGAYRFFINAREKTFLELAGIPIILTNPKSFAPTASLPATGALWKSLYSDEKTHEEWVDLAIAGAKKAAARAADRKAFRIPMITRIRGKRCVVPARVEASIIGGIFGGLGHGINQAAQNKFWSSEFAASRKHELEMLQAGFNNDTSLANLGHEHQAETIDQMKKNDTQRQMDTAALAAGSKGISRPPPSSGAGPTPASISEAPEKPPTALDATPQQVAGENQGAEEMYHPTNAMADGAATLANPVTVSSAVNPYTEGMKRT